MLRTGLVLMGMAVAAVVVAVIINNKEIKDGTNRAIPKHLLLVLELMQMVSGINITNSIMDNSKVVVTNDPMSRQTPFYFSYPLTHIGHTFFQFFYTSLFFPHLLIFPLSPVRANKLER